MKSLKTVESYISKHEKWKETLTALRKIALETKMKETIKWGLPVYTVSGKNVVGLGAFKSFAGLWFFHGALLKDSKKKLTNAQEGVTKAMRQWRFTSVDEIKKEEENIKNYILEAIRNQESGKQVKPRRGKPVIIPEELKLLFKDNPKIKNSFDSLSLTRKREFTEYISEAKRKETRQKRLEKIKPLLQEGIGLHDKYRKIK